MDIELKKEKYFIQDNVKMSINLEKYCINPEGYIEGSITLIPKIKGDIKIKDPTIILTLTQYEFLDYKKEKDLNKKENTKHKEIIFNKEAKIEIENNTISCKLQIPIKVSVPKSDKLLPTFNLKNKDFISGVRHIFTVNFPDINSINSIGIIISELNYNEIKDSTQNNNTIFKTEQINKMGLINKGKISYCLRLAKNQYRHDEDINMKIMVDSNGLQEMSINEIKIKLQRKITIFGYTVNSDLRYTLYEKKFEKDELDKLAKNNSKIYELENTFQKLDQNNFDEKEIEQYVHFNENIIDNYWNEKCVAPTIKGYYFSCEYKIKIRTMLDSSLTATKKIDFPILIYFSDDYFNQYKLKFEQEKDVKFGSFILISNKHDKNNKSEENNDNKINSEEKIKKEEKEEKEEKEKDN